MPTRHTRITKKGQLVIPKHLRDQNCLLIGDSVRIEDQAHAVRVVRRSGWARATAGSLASLGPLVQPEELDELAERAALQETRDQWGASN